MEGVTIQVFLTAPSLRSLGKPPLATDSQVDAHQPTVGASTVQLCPPLIVWSSRNCLVCLTTLMAQPSVGETKSICKKPSLLASSGRGKARKSRPPSSVR